MRTRHALAGFAFQKRDREGAILQEAYEAEEGLITRARPKEAQGLRGNLLGRAWN
jgi:hypothetical protein